MSPSFLKLLIYYFFLSVHPVLFYLFVWLSICLFICVFAIYSVPEEGLSLSFLDPEDWPALLLRRIPLKVIHMRQKYNINQNIFFLNWYLGITTLVTKMRIGCASFCIFPHLRCASNASRIQHFTSKKMRIRDAHPMSIFWCAVLFYAHPMNIFWHFLQTCRSAKHSHQMRI